MVILRIIIYYYLCINVFLFGFYVCANITLQTFFFSLRNFFDCTGSVNLRWVDKPPVCGPAAPDHKRVLLTPDVEKQFKNLAVNHSAPSLMSDIRAYTVLHELGEKLGILEDLIDPGTKLPTDSVPVLGQYAANSSIVAIVMELLNRYVEVWLLTCRAM